jgi:hypothetical protein
MTDKCYLLSGLGADGTVFQYLDFEVVEVEYMEWLPPLPKETLPAYAKRMTQKITTPHPILVGLSFGGMVAMEIAKQIPVKKVILISSAKERKELPWFYRFSAKLKLQKILLYTLIKRTNGFTYWLFGATSAHEKALLKEIFRKTPTTFLKWAINAILTWKNTEIYTHILHIHGDKDRILPYKNVKDTLFITGGGHSMIVNKAHEITPLINKFLNNAND